MSKHSAILKALCKWMERWCYWGQGRSKGVLFFTVSQCSWVTPTAPDPGSVGSPALRTKKNQWPASLDSILDVAFLPTHLGTASAHLVCRKWPRCQGGDSHVAVLLVLSTWRREEWRRHYCGLHVQRVVDCSVQELENVKEAESSGYIPKDWSAVPTKGLAEGKWFTEGLWTACMIEWAQWSFQRWFKHLVEVGDGSFLFYH